MLCSKFIQFFFRPKHNKTVYSTIFFAFAARDKQLLFRHFNWLCFKVFIKCLCRFWHALKQRCISITKTFISLSWNASKYFCHIFRYFPVLGWKISLRLFKYRQKDFYQDPTWPLSNFDDISIYPKRFYHTRSLKRT